MKGIEAIEINGKEWERFPWTGQGPRTATDPAVTLQRSGRVITLNKAAYEALDEPVAVELLFSKKERVMGLRKASPREPFAASVRAQKRRGKPPSNYIVTALRFINYYNIDVSDSPRYRASLLDDGTLTVDLKDTHISAMMQGVSVEELVKGE